MVPNGKLEEFYKKYGKEKVDELIKYLSYKKDVESLPKDQSDTKPIMYVFRHGQSVDNADFIYSGWRKSPLTDKGRDQAKVLAQKLKDKKN
jgi:hypothetical protein